MSQKRIRDYGVIVGELPTGKLNKITDVKGCVWDIVPLTTKSTKPV